MKKPERVRPTCNRPVGDGLGLLERPLWVISGHSVQAGLDDFAKLPGLASLASRWRLEKDEAPDTRLPGASAVMPAQSLVAQE